MKYLADTDILIDHIRGRKYLDARFIKDGVGMSIISLGELLYGAYKSTHTKKSLESIDELLRLGVVVKNLNGETMDIYAKLKVELEKLGQKLDEFDLLIAATARINSLTLITRNIRHFKRIKGLQVTD